MPLWLQTGSLTSMDALAAAGHNNQRLQLIKFLRFSFGALAFFATVIVAAKPAAATATTTGPMPEPGSAATAEFALLWRPRFIHRKSASIQLFTVKSLYGGIHVSLGGQFDECKSARSSQFHIAHDLDARCLDILAGAELIEIRLQYIERQVSYK
jgi:hypothetical protein